MDGLVKKNFKSKFHHQKRFFFFEKSFFFLVLVDDKKKSFLFFGRSSICWVILRWNFFATSMLIFAPILIGSFWGWSEDFWRLPACRRPSGRRPTRSDRRERSTLEGGSRVAAPPIGGRRPPRGCSIACSILCVRSPAFSILGALAERIKSERKAGWTD